MGMLERLKDLKEKLDIKEFYSDDEDYILLMVKCALRFVGGGYLTGYRGFLTKRSIRNSKNKN